MAQTFLSVPVDWFLDRFRTAVNCFGDSVGAAVVDQTFPKPPAETILVKSPVAAPVIPPKTSLEKPTQKPHETPPKTSSAS